MSRRLALPLLLLVACKKSEETSPPEPATKPALAPTTATAPPTAAATTAPPTTTDEAFRTAATDLATRHKLLVQAWGTAELDDKPELDRWAQLGPDDRNTNAIGERGAYLIEASGKAYLVEVYWDGRTKPWMEAKTGTIPWTTNADPFIAHQQGHRGGFEETHFAIRGGEVVVLRETKQDDGREGDGPVESAYADGKGKCEKPCPKATDKEFTVYTKATVAEVASTIKAPQ